VVPTCIRNAVIWGNHSATQVPSIDHAEVRLDNEDRWVDVAEVISDREWLEQVGACVRGGLWGVARRCRGPVATSVLTLYVRACVS
jgi:malate/lactate dehydrogenase